MRMPPWLRGLLSRRPDSQAGRTGRQRKQSVTRLALERLEDRTVPSTVSILTVGNGAESVFDGKLHLTVEGATSATATNISYSVTGTATSGSDYSALSGTVVIPANTDGADIDIDVLDDNTVEATETVVIQIVASDNGDISIYEGNASATVQIRNNDSATISIGGPSATEGNSLSFSVTIDNPVDVAVTADRATGDGTTNPATVADSDYTALASSNVTLFAANTTTAFTITVATTSDSKVELDEQLQVILSNLSAGGRDVQFNGGEVTLTGTGTITNDDIATLRVATAINAADPLSPTAAEDANDRENPRMLVTGTDVVWTYLLTNTGVSPLKIDSLRDVVSGADFSPNFVSGDANSNNKLDPGETWLYTSAGVVTYQVQDRLYGNVATATATDSIGLTAAASDSSYHFGTPRVTLNVTTTADEGLGSLRAAISQANDQAGPDTIIFDPAVFFATAQTITLGSVLIIAEDLTITGPAAGVIVSGNNLSRVFFIESSLTAALSGLTVTGGRSPLDGGGIFNRGTLTLSNCTVSGNTAPDFGGGGGIFNRGTLTMSNCTVSGNTANPTIGVGLGGGGIWNVGTLTLSNCTVSGNTTPERAGGILNDGTLTLSDCTVAGNTAKAGGGIFNDGTLTLSDCTISGNTAAGGGGGIEHSLGTLTLSNCTVTGNTATDGGGGIEHGLGTLTLSNCTVFGNTAFRGGGILTFTQLLNPNVVTLGNTIVAGNFTGGGSSANDIDGNHSITANFSLIGATTSGITYSAGSGNNITGQDPLLASLANNGGPTQTQALRPGSPALNNGSNLLVPAGVLTDQRGPGFARIASNRVDIGAYEIQNQAPTDIALSPASVAENQPAGTTIGTFSTTDPDSGDTFTYVLVAGSADNALFSISGGTLWTAASFDFEARSSYSIQVTSIDAGGLFVEKVLTISVTNVNEAPSITVPAAQTAYEDADMAIRGLSVGDAEGDSLRVTLQVGHGNLTLVSTTGLSVSGNGSGSVTLSGRLADLNAALAGLIYRGALNYSGTDTLAITASDGSLTSSASVAIQVRSADRQAADLRALVDALREAGALNQGQANSLNRKLQLNSNNGDVGQVQSFLNEVNALLRAGILREAQANVLLGQGNFLLTSVTTR